MHVDNTQKYTTHATKNQSAETSLPYNFALKGQCSYGKATNN